MASCGSTAGRYWYLRFAWYVHRLGSVPAGAGGGVRAVAPLPARTQRACCSTSSASPSPALPGTRHWGPGGGQPEPGSRLRRPSRSLGPGSA
jgi:hypothetical protein